VQFSEKQEIILCDKATNNWVNVKICKIHNGAAQLRVLTFFAGCGIIGNIMGQFAPVLFEAYGERRKVTARCACAEAVKAASCR